MKFKAVFSVLLLAVPVFSIAHPGRTAADGCHYCRTSCAEWGETAGARHCHGGSSIRSHRTRPSTPTTSAYSRSSLSPAPAVAANARPLMHAQPWVSIAVGPVFIAAPDNSKYIGHEGRYNVSIIYRSSRSCDPYIMLGSGWYEEGNRLNWMRTDVDERWAAIRLDDVDRGAKILTIPPVKEILNGVYHGKWLDVVAHNNFGAITQYWRIQLAGSAKAMNETWQACLEYVDNRHQLADQAGALQKEAEALQKEAEALQKELDAGLPLQVSPLN